MNHRPEAFYAGKFDSYFHFDLREKTFDKTFVDSPGVFTGSSGLWSGT
jgi:hypothetical protein